MVFAHIAAQNLKTGLTDGFLSLDAGDDLCCPVKRGHPPIQVHRVDPICDGIQNNLIQSGHGFLKVEHPGHHFTS